MNSYLKSPILCMHLLYYFPGPLEESAIWIEELPPEDILQRGSHSVAQTSGYQDPLGVIKEQTRYSLEAKLHVLL